MSMVERSATPQSTILAVQDLLGVALLSVLATVLALIEVSALLPLRFVLGILLALFFPGYPLVSFVFPKTPSDDDPGQSLLSRAVLSVALSVVIVPLLAIGLQYSGIGIRRVPVAVGLCGITILLTGLAIWRRLSISPNRRFTIIDEMGTVWTPFRTVLNKDQITQALIGLLVISLLVTGGGAAYSTFGSTDGRATTEFYLLSENRTGSFVASGYPTEFVQGEPQRIGVGIENHEGAHQNYTAVIAVQSMTERSKDADMIERQVLRRINISVGENQQTIVPLNVSVPVTGENLQLVFELYQGTSERTDPYRETYLWINSTAPTANSQ